MSYVLFRTDTNQMEILGARCPDPRVFPVGRSFAAVLDLSPEAMAYLRSNQRDPKPFFLETKVGIGLLHKGYDRQAGVGLYLHIHGSPSSLARLIRGGIPVGYGDGGVCVSSDMVARGPIRARDEATYGILREAWSEICDRQKRGGVWSARSDSTLSLLELARGLEELAAFAGCSLTWSPSCHRRGGGEGMEPCPTTVRCYRPRLLEAIVLFLLTEARMLGADGRIVCHAGARGTNRHLILFLEYEVTEKRLAEEETILLHTACRHMGLAAELCGMTLDFTVLTPSRKEKRAGRLPLVSVCLETLYDPAILPTTDLKAGLKLLYEMGEGDT